MTVWSRWWAGAGAVAAAGIVAAFLTIPNGPNGPSAPQMAPQIAQVHYAPAPDGAPTSRASSAAGAAGAASAQPAPAREPAAQQALTGPVVALGDSYTAGDLLPLSLAGAPPGCLRSARGYAVQVAKALGAAARFVEAACTGAGVKEMTGSQRTYFGTNSPQLSALAPDDSLVMLTLGGDDMGFLHVLDTCMKLSVTDLDGSPCQSHFTSGGTDQLAAKVAAEGPRLARVLNAIRGLAPHARVLLVGYPDVFPLRGGCWPAVPVTDGDIAYLRGIGAKLNAMLSGAAAAAGVTFVDTYTPTIGHDFCQGAMVKDVEGLIPTSLAAPFHPNERGQAAMAAAVLAALRSG
jgi:lysophospholipase L1-like esterase